jgi:hypothetical protein
MGQMEGEGRETSRLQKSSNKKLHSMSGEEKLQILQGKRYAKWRNVDK